MTLLDLVDELTIEHIVTTPLETGKNHYERHPGLIAQLRAAIASSLVGGDRSTASKGGFPLNVDALDRYNDLEAAIATTYADAGLGVPGLLPEDNLRALYAHRWQQADEPEQAMIAATLAGWKATIEALFDPPRQRQVTDPCPVCHSTTWVNPAGDTVPHPIVIEYPEGMERLEDAVGRCRAVIDGEPCGEVWKGERRLRELSWAIDAARE